MFWKNQMVFLCMDRRSQMITRNSGSGSKKEDIWRHSSDSLRMVGYGIVSTIKYVT